VQRSALLYVCGVVLNDIALPVRSFPYVQFTPYLQLTGVLQKWCEARLRSLICSADGGVGLAVHGRLLLDRGRSAMDPTVPAAGDPRHERHRGLCRVDAGRKHRAGHVFGPNLYEVFLEVASPANASLAYAVTWLVCAVAWFMYRRRWFLRF